MGAIEKIAYCLGPAFMKRAMSRAAPLALLLSVPGAAQSAIVTYCCDEAAETAYQTALGGLGFAASLSESFENGQWVDARTIPQVSVTNLGITWSRPGAFLRTSTGGGDVHDGSYIMFTWDNSTGLPTHAIPDGYTLTASGPSLFGVGGWFQAGTTANIDFIVDGDPTRVDFTGLETSLDASWKFLGFVETDPALGFTSVEIMETDETGDETKIFFSDDFTLGASPVPLPASLPLLGSGLMAMVGFLGRRRSKQT